MDNFNRRKAVVSFLIRITKVDGKVDQIEKKFINDVARQLNLSPENIDEIIANPDRYKIDPPSAEQERMTILYYVLFTMAVDGAIHEEEERLCYKIGLRLGFNEYMTQDLISVMKQYLNKELPENALLDIIRKHQN